MRFKRFLSIFVILLVSVFIFSGCNKKEQAQGEKTVDGKQQEQTQQEGEQQQEQKQEQTQQQQQEIFSGKIKDLMSGGKTLKCTWTYKSDGLVAESIIYLDGEKYASEVIVPDTEDKTMMVHSIFDGEWAYSWTEGMLNGMKMRPSDFEDMDEGEDESEGPEGSDNGYANFINEQYDFSCENWKADSAKFAIPSNVEFEDFAQQLEKMEQTTKDLQKNMEGVCNMLQGEEKIKCLEDIKN
jgi:hypothetical protein